jgi:hypothetical protein
MDGSFEAWLEERRQIYDEPKFRGYEVILDVWPGVFAYGILLVPKDIKPGEKRPGAIAFALSSAKAIR